MVKKQPTTKKLNIRLWIAVFAAVLICAAFPLMAAADDEIPYADLIGDLETATDKIIIEGKAYSIANANNTVVKADLVKADLALLEWDAIGNNTDNDKTLDKIVGVFDHQIVRGYWNVYEEIYVKLLAQANSTYRSENVSSETIAADTINIRRYSYKNSDPANGINIKFGGTRTVNGTFIILADDIANFNDTTTRFVIAEGGTLVVQGRSPDKKIKFNGNSEQVHTTNFISVKGKLYLSNVELKDLTYGYTSDGSTTLSTIMFPVGNIARYMYMSNCILNNLSALEAGGIFCKVYSADDNDNASQSRLYINNSDFIYCSTSGKNTVGGSAIRSYAADRCQLQVVNCDFEYNTCTATGTSSGGGAVYWKSAEGKATFIDCRFKHNEATKVGGAIYNTGEMYLQKCTFEKNEAADGGAIAVEPPYTSSKYTMNYQGLSGSLKLDGETTIKNNKATNRGGGLYFNAYASQIGSTENDGTQIMTFTMVLNIEGATIENNTANYGGGVAMWLNFAKRNYTTGITITADPNTGKESSIKNNTANIDGGAIWMGSDSGCWCRNEAGTVSGVTMNSGRLEGNKALAGSGGAIFIDVGDPTATMDFNLNGGTVKGNWAQNSGGAAFIGGGNFTMSDGSMQDCYTVTQNGGAIYMSSGKFTMTAGEIKNCCTEDTGSGSGGAVYMAAGTFDMSGGSITDCHSETGSGGAVYMANGTFDLGGGSITSCTALNGNGGGVYLGGGKLNVTFGELSGNQALNGGGAYVHASSAEDGVFVSGGTIQNNTATQNGGGIAVNNGAYKMTGGKVDNNEAALAGGGIYVAASGVNAQVDILSGTVSNNNAGTSGGALAVVGRENGSEKISVTIGVNEVHPCVHGIVGVQDENCPVLTGNFATVSGGGVYITGGSETHLNTYCMTEEKNYAEDGDGDEDTHKSKSNFMMVEGGTVILSTADADKKGDDHGKIVIHNTIHVFAGHVDLYGSIENPLILGNMTVDVPDERGSFSDHRLGGGSSGDPADPEKQKYIRVQYCENFYDPILEMVTGQYTVILVEKEEGEDYALHTILPALYEHDGYMIDGWWTDSNNGIVGGTEYKVNTEYELGNDLKLWAKWLLKGYYVYFDPGTDGSYRGSMETERYFTDATVNLPQNLFFITGKQFAGWDYAGREEGEPYLADQASVKNLTGEREITLVAQWVECNHAGEYLTVTQSGTNILQRTCVCEACTQTATLTAEDSVYTGSKQSGANLRITGGSNNGQPTPAWNVPIVHSGINYSDVTISEGDILTAAGRYTAVISDYVTGLSGEAVSAEVQFEIKKADNPTPQKPEYSSDEHAEGAAGGKIIIINPVHPVGVTPLYKIEWFDKSSEKHVETAGLSDATTNGFELTTEYTNYYVYVMYEGDENHNPSEWVRAESVLFYKGKVYIHISEQQGINYSTGSLDGTSGLRIDLTAYNDYYLYNTSIVQTHMTEGTPVLTIEGSFDTYSVTNIPETDSARVDLYLSITGVKKKVVITSAVEQSEVFGQVKSNSATVTGDSAYTAYFEIENYDVYTYPTLTFNRAIKPDTTVILVDKTISGAPKYYAYVVKSELTSIPLYGENGFVQMGTSNTCFAVPESSSVALKYQVIVDFSDSAGMPYDTLTTSIKATAPANVPDFTSNGKPVTLKNAPAADISIPQGQGGIQQTVSVTVPQGSAESSKWLGRSCALILTCNGTFELPADAYIQAVDDKQNVTPAYRNSEGKYIIPVTGGRVNLTLVSDMFGAETASYPFEITLVTVQSRAAKSSANGQELAAGSLTFTKAADIAEPAVSVTTTAATYTAGGTVCAIVAANQSDNTILVLRLLSRGLPGTEAGTKYTDTGWKVSIGENTDTGTTEDPTVGNDTTGSGTGSSGVTKLENGSYKVLVPLGNTPVGTGCLVLELRNAAGDVMISTECYFVIQ